LQPLASELRKDRLAALLIRTGGVTVILVVVAMVLIIAGQALPLFLPAGLGPVVETAAADARVIGMDSRSEALWWLAPDGRIHAAAEDCRFEIADLGIGGAPVAADLEIGGVLSMVTGDGRGVVGRVGSVRRTTDPPSGAPFRWRLLAELEPATVAGQVVGVTAAADDDRVLVVRWTTDEAEILELDPGPGGGSSRRLVLPNIATAAVSPSLDHLVFVMTDGALRGFHAADVAPTKVLDLDFPVAAARFLSGGRSLVAGGSDGSVGVLLETPRVEIINRRGTAFSVGGYTIAAGERVVVPAISAVSEIGNRSGLSVRRIDMVWRLIHRLPRADAAITAIAAGRRGRTFATADGAGVISIFNATSARLLRRDRWTSDAVTAVAMAPRSDAIAAAGTGRLLRRSFVCAHPEISLGTLFLPVWYEGFAEPRAVWQTSGGSDEFQPKFGLGPLLLGTVKATVYAMLVSVPLALLAALYVSQLAPGWLQSVVKPTVEMMAAVPTVVVGFLAALWLAPRLQLWLFPALAAAAALPLGVLVARSVWRLLPRGTRRHFPEGAELVVLLGSCVLVVVVVVILSGPVERWLFDGDFARALFENWGIRYEQRNALIVGLALGFAVIPVIFTIAEDACSGVPPTLVRAARALGATRWQAATRLVAPAASPGLFAAVMLGLGRAVGETMIVLMAAGNTPILDLSPFNGMRTMSAAIAFEIPEASVGGTLFRVLFLTGLLLFVMSLVFTTAADIVGRRLRKRYAQF
jgi:phosphate transport system permease protein